MNNIELYSDFLDGACDTQSEKKFIDKFVNDEGFRSDFRHFILISKELSSNSGTFAPTDDTNKSVYAALGFSLTGETNPAINKPALGFLKSKLFSSIATGIFAAVITYFIMLGQFSGNSTINDKLADNKNHIANVQMNTPAFSGFAETSNNKLKKLEDKSIIKNLKAGERKIIQIHDTVYRNTINPINEVFYSKLPDDIKLNIIDKKNPAINLLQAILPANEKSNSRYSNPDIGLTVEFNNSAAWNIPQETIAPLNSSKFNGLNVSFLYKLNEFVKIGLDISQETFYLVYTGTEADNVTYRYRQQPNFTSYSVLLKLYPYEFNQFKPFVVSGFGINSGGYVTRIGTGFEYCINNNVSFLFGMEYSNLWFNHQGAGFTASKAAIIYGLSYQF